MTPTIILVPGMCSVGKQVFAPLATELKALGYEEVIVFDLQSVDCLDRMDQLQPNALEADIRRIRSIIEGQVVAGKDVVLVAHSYGGTPSLYAADGFWSHKRSGLHKGGVVVKTILLTASLTSPGSSVGGERAAWAAAAGVTLEDAKYGRFEMLGEEGSQVPILHPEGIGEVWFNDMPKDEALEWGRTLKPSCLGNVMSPTPQATVSEWRIAYLVTTEDDLAMSEAFQLHLIDKAQKEGATVEQVTTIKSGHFVQITHAKEVAAWIQDVIG